MHQVWWMGRSRRVCINSEKRLWALSWPSFCPHVSPLQPPDWFFMKFGIEDFTKICIKMSGTLHEHLRVLPWQGVYYYYIVHSDMCASTIKRTHHCVAVATAVTRTRHIVTLYVRTLPSLFGLQVGWTSCKLGNPSRRWHSLRGSCCKCALCIWVSARRLGLRQDSNLSLPLKRPSGVSVRLVWTWITGSMSRSLVGASGLLTLPVGRRRLPAARSIPPSPPWLYPSVSWSNPLTHRRDQRRDALLSARPVPPRNYKIRSDLWCTKYVLG